MFEDASMYNYSLCPFSRLPIMSRLMEVCLSWRFCDFWGEHHFLVQGGVILFDRSGQAGTPDRVSFANYDPTNNTRSGPRHQKFEETDCSIMRVLPDLIERLGFYAVLTISELDSLQDFMRGFLCYKRLPWCSLLDTKLTNHFYPSMCFFYYIGDYK